MFRIEIIAGLAAGSASLQADALDFLADTANYGISLFVDDFLGAGSEPDAENKVTPPAEPLRL